MASTSLYSTINPTAQVTTNNLVLLAGSILNTLRYSSLSYTISNSGANSIQWKVIAGNLSDLSDAVEIQASATITSGSFASYATTTTPYIYYGVQVESTVDGATGTAVLNGVAKK